MISRIQFENFNKLFITEVHVQFRINVCSLIDRHARDYYMIAIYLFIKLNSISISSIFKTIKKFHCITEFINLTYNHASQQQLYNRNSQTKSNCMQLAISIDAQPVITSAVKLGEVPMKFGNFVTPKSWALEISLVL
ncbi:hypothetical protein T03_18085 [Trichinella britovi]|uniref:Uncharacterized protein n=1 Tax=Trichinella britovi TaxID=45882 RepID=A0A0V1D5D4_TRIBR|nr:hypothetical protein T03_18085 [Trichinella britovi]